MSTVAQLQQLVDELWPVSAAEAWDAVGLIAGAPSDQVSKVLLAVDATSETAREAIAVGADLLLVHHPLLLRGVTTIAAATPKGAVLTELIRGRVALIAAHTNADVVTRGTSAELASAIQLRDTIAFDGEQTGLGRVGSLPAPITLGALAERIAEVVPGTASGIRVAGDRDALVQRIAVCGGAGDSYLEHPAVLTADVYVTGDLRHHPASDALERHRLGGGPALIDVPHWAAESLWLPAAAEQLRAALPEVDIVLSSVRTDPWDFRIDQEYS